MCKYHDTSPHELYVFICHQDPDICKKCPISIIYIRLILCHPYIKICRIRGACNTGIDWISWFLSLSFSWDFYICPITTSWEGRREFGKWCRVQGWKYFPLYLCTCIYLVCCKQIHLLLISLVHIRMYVYGGVLFVTVTYIRTLIKIEWVS